MCQRYPDKKGSFAFILNYDNVFTATLGMIKSPSLEYKPQLSQERKGAGFLGWCSIAYYSTRSGFFPGTAAIKPEDLHDQPCPCVCDMHTPAHTHTKPPGILP